MPNNKKKRGHLFKDILSRRKKIKPSAEELERVRKARELYTTFQVYGQAINYAHSGSKVKPYDHSSLRGKTTEEAVAMLIQVAYEGKQAFKKLTTFEQRKEAAGFTKEVYVQGVSFADADEMFDILGRYKFIPDDIRDVIKKLSSLENNLIKAYEAYRMQKEYIEVKRKDGISISNDELNTLEEELKLAQKRFEDLVAEMKENSYKPIAEEFERRNKNILIKTRSSEVAPGSVHEIFFEAIQESTTPTVPASSKRKSTSTALFIGSSIQAKVKSQDVENQIRTLKNLNKQYMIALLKAVTPKDMQVVDALKNDILNQAELLSDTTSKLEGQKKIEVENVVRFSRDLVKGQTKFTQNLQELKQTHITFMKASKEFTEVMKTFEYERAKGINPESKEAKELAEKISNGFDHMRKANIAFNQCVDACKDSSLYAMADAHMYLAMQVPKPGGKESETIDYFEERKNAYEQARRVLPQLKPVKPPRVNMPAQSLPLDGVSSSPKQKANTKKVFLQAGIMTPMRLLRNRAAVYDSFVTRYKEIYPKGVGLVTGTINDRKDMQLGRDEVLNPKCKDILLGGPTGDKGEEVIQIRILPKGISIEGITAKNREKALELAAKMMVDVYGSKVSIKVDGGTPEIKAIAEQALKNARALDAGKYLDHSPPSSHHV